MPVYRSRTILEIAGDLRAFLSLEAGISRGSVPDPEAQARELREARDRIKKQAEEIGRLRGSSRWEGRPTGPATREASEGPDPLRIVHVGVFDTGGGARATHRLHTGLRRLGHDSNVLASRAVDWCRDDSTVEVVGRPTDPRSRRRRRRRVQAARNDLLRYEDSRPSGYEGFTDDRGRHGSELLEGLTYDLVNLHWIGGFLDFRLFFSTVPRHTPVVWTLHDMNAFTGGCHFDHGCGKFADRCGACPQLGSMDGEDLTRQVWRRKHEALAGVDEGRLHVVGVSEWMSEQARRSSLLGKFPVTTIRLGLDLGTFAPRDRSLARSVLGIPEDARAVLFVAEHAISRRKGFAQLAEALDGMEETPGLLLLSLGHGDPRVGGRIPHRHLGYVGDDYLLSLIYSAADVFVVPSLQDNLPQTALQAIACGTPTVGFAVGGIPDMVRPGVTGELAPPKDSAGLREALLGLLLDEERCGEMSANCRRVAEEEFSEETQARRYVELYRSMLGVRA